MNSSEIYRPPKTVLQQSPPDVLETAKKTVLKISGSVFALLLVAGTQLVKFILVVAENPGASFFDTRVPFTYDPTILGFSLAQVIFATASIGLLAWAVTDILGRDRASFARSHLNRATSIVLTGTGAILFLLTALYTRNLTQTGIDASAVGVTQLSFLLALFSTFLVATVAFLRWRGSIYAVASTSAVMFLLCYIMAPIGVGLGIYWLIVRKRDIARAREAVRI